MRDHCFALLSRRWRIRRVFCVIDETGLSKEHSVGVSRPYSGRGVSRTAKAGVFINDGQRLRSGADDRGLLCPRHGQQREAPYDAASKEMVLHKPAMAGLCSVGSAKGHCHAHGYGDAVTAVITNSPQLRSDNKTYGCPSRSHQTFALLKPKASGKPIPSLAQDFPIRTCRPCWRVKVQKGSGSTIGSISCRGVALLCPLTLSRKSRAPTRHLRSALAVFARQTDPCRIGGGAVCAGRIEECFQRAKEDPVRPLEASWRMAPAMTLVMAALLSLPRLSAICAVRHLANERKEVQIRQSLHDAQKCAHPSLPNSRPNYEHLPSESRQSSTSFSNGRLATEDQAKA